MTETPDATSGRMEGHGYYTAHSDVQQEYGELAIGWFAEAAASAADPSPLPFVIADLGAAGGGSSLQPVLKALDARTSQGPVLVVHTDIPSNDFSALFTLVDSSPHTYLAPDVFPLAEGRSFYERLFPDGFVTLAWSSVAVHWLSSVPEPIDDHIFSSRAAGPTRDALRDRSRQDWLTFLRHRDAELRPGGGLIVVGGAARDDGSSGAEGLMDAADAALRDLVDRGVLAEAEYRRMTIPTWNRTKAEFTAPFDDGQLAGVLELRRAELRWLPDRYFAAYQSDGDLDRFVENVADFFRAAFEESLMSALEPGRADRDGLVSAFRDG
ncbi:MAG: class I SAM-dependent methyltransferase, partial [Gemmatimonadota bacterium]|nr:class I SAM-dependent methyltransferase [Gemmatimonadota bacterium]